jgi:K+ transporter
MINCVGKLIMSVQIAFTLVVFPCLLLAYTGQAAYIISNKDHVVDAFYRSIPGPCPSELTNLAVIK